jgi:hypothetical protein
MMTFVALLAELETRQIKVSINGAGPHVLNVEPRERITPELEAGLREHKDALIRYIQGADRAVLHVVAQVRAILDTLPSADELKDADSPLRKLVGLSGRSLLLPPLKEIASLMADTDPLTRELIRADVIDALESRKVRSPAKLIDAALTGTLEERGDEDASGRPLVAEPLEPWPDPVDGATLLNDLETAFTKHVVLPEAGATVIVLWLLHAHVVNALDISPYLVLSSPEKRCGKTTTLSIIGALTPRTLAASNVSGAALFRAIEKYEPMLVVDEADTWITDNPELRGILNSGHTRSTAFVVRCVGDNQDPRLFNTFCAKVVALIGELPATIDDRSLVLTLRRKKKEKVERVRLAKLPTQMTQLRRQAARWAMDHLEKLREAEPEMPTDLDGDRATDNWRPLLAIADLAGGDWPTKARTAAGVVSGTGKREDSSEAVQLLSDLRDLYQDGPAVDG